MVKGETKEYTTKDKTMEETVKIKYNHLSILVMHHSQTTLSTEGAHKDTL
jgi:hypothetical protein